MSYTGKIAVASKVLNLDMTLLGGQSFRWTKVMGEKNAPPEWHGVAFNAFWQLQQTHDNITYKVYPVDGTAKTNSDYQQLLERYLRLDFDLNTHIKHWREAHEHFARLSSNLKAVRVLCQEPLENIISFICSQNNNIKRISTMIQWLCSKYGIKIGEFAAGPVYTFPTLEALVNDQQRLESSMREAKFGYRAKFIAQTIAKISENGGYTWFDKLRELPYEEARVELVSLPGIGFKVADCICLMSLNHLQSVPIDTHIYKIAKSSYMPSLANVKTVTPKIYEDISKHFRETYGPYAGWAQAVLFCSELQQFKEQDKPDNGPKAKKKRPQK